MKRCSRKLAESRLDACPMVGTNCRGYKSDSRCVGYERMGRALATARLYEFRPLYGGGNSPTSQCSWELGVEWNMDYSELPTPAPVGKGGLYRVRCPSQWFGGQGWSSGE